MGCSSLGTVTWGIVHISPNAESRFVRAFFFERVLILSLIFYCALLSHYPMASYDDMTRPRREAERVRQNPDALRMPEWGRLTALKYLVL